MQQWQKYLAELFGTLVLVLIGTMAIVADGGLGDSATSFVPLAFGLGLLAALYAFGEVSGGHFNPAVTLAAFVDRRISIAGLIGYWIAQVAGALLASLTLLWMTSDADVESTITSYSDGLGTAFISEIFLAAVFVAVFLQVTRGALSNQSFLAVSLTFAAVHYAGIPFSGASVNPARSLAPMLVGSENLEQLWFYAVAPLAGALVGWAVWKSVMRGDTALRNDLEAVQESM